MKKQSLTVLTAIACILFTLAFANPSQAQSMQSQLGNLSWTREAWTGSDAPYITLRQKIVREAKTSRKDELDSFLERYRRAAAQKPKSAITQFAWGHAAIEARRAGLDVRGWKTPEAIYRALGKAPSPRTYEYARLRFIAAMWWWDFSLEPLGDRLLKRNPNDYDVLYYSISHLQGSRAKRQKALRYAQRMMRLRKSLSSYSLMGFVQMRIHRIDNVPSAGDKAIAAYEQWLKMAPRTARYAESRKRVQRFISNIRRVQRERKR